jgi:hypothetical protein
MRERHLPRLCRICQAPMARQEDRCWRCGTRWSVRRTPPTEDRPQRTLRVIVGGASDDGAADPSTAAAVADDAQGSSGETARDLERWLNEGGRLESRGEASPPRTTTAGK